MLNSGMKFLRQVLSKVSSSRICTIEPTTRNHMSPTRLLKLTTENSRALARTGAEVLQSGGIIATPTDTIYGLAADFQNNDAISRLYEIKGRDFDKPVAICISEVEEIYRWAHVTVPAELLQTVLPGPVTLVFERRSVLNPLLNPSTHLIGIRIPDCCFTRELATHGPFALTSANPSSTPSTISPEEFKSLWPKLDLVIDGGKIKSLNEESDLSVNSERSGSTVIDLSKSGLFKINRAGTQFEYYVNLLRVRYALQQCSD